MFIIPTILLSTFVFADVQIEDILPNTTIAVVTVRNVADLSNKMKALGVCDSVCEFGQYIAESNDGIDYSELSELCQDLLSDMGLDSLDLPNCPSGSFQAGIYPVVDYEAGSVSVALLAIAELGDSQWSSVIDNSISKFADRLKVQIEEVDLAGTSVWMLSTTSESAFSDIDLSKSDLERLYVILREGCLIVGTDPDGVASAIDVVDGNKQKDSLADSDLWAELQSRVTSDGDVKASILLTNVADTIMQMDDSGMAMMVLPMIKSFFGDIDGIMETVAFHSNSDIALDANYTIYMGDGRNGLLGLISEKSSTSEIPAYVTQDTLSYSQLQVDMNEVVPFLMETIASNPMLAMQIGPQSEQIEQTLQKAFAPLGTQVHMVSTGYFPLDKDSLGYLIAIECIDDPAFSDFLATVMPGMGADPSDFLGYQIYTAEISDVMMLPMDLSFSCSVAGGYVFIGSTRPVEQALRSIANPEKSRIANNETTALGFVSRANSTGWGYADPAKSFKIKSQLMDSISEDMFADIEEFDPEMAGEMRAEFLESRKQQAEIMNIFAGLFGKTSWNLDTDSNGFTAHAVMLMPSSN